jgi:hypothetical protein
MSTIEQLLKPVFEGGIRSVNFFNGRVLSGEDLSDEQEAQRQARRLVGQALGEGVAFGLEVAEAAESSTAQFPVLAVAPGLAVNRAGQTLRLRERADVELVWREGAAAAGHTNVTFRDCAPLDPAIYVANEGVYLLTVAPAEGREGRAPAAGADNVPAAFNTRYLVEGVQFRVVEVLTGTRLGDLRTLRNRVAYACFGAESTRAVAADPFGAALDAYGLLDSFRPHVLTDCEVPLALVYWSNVRGIQFIDLWSARRRLTAPAHSRRWHALVGDRRSAEAEAMVLQFQDHIADLLARADLNLGTAAAAQHFRYLPPVGLVPVARGGFKGVNPNTFFGGHAVRGPAYLDGGAVRSLVAAAAAYEPVDLNRGEAVWLYQVVQNEQAFNAAAAGVRPYLVFTTAQMPYRGAARLDLARFDQSNFA